MNEHIKIILTYFVAKKKNSNGYNENKVTLKHREFELRLPFAYICLHMTKKPGKQK